MFANFFTFLFWFFPDVSPIFESNFSNVAWRRATMFCKFIFKMLLTFSYVFPKFLPTFEINLSIVSTCQNDCLRSHPHHLRSISLHCAPSVFPWTALTCNAPPLNHRRLNPPYHPPNIPNQAPVKKPKQSPVLMPCSNTKETNKKSLILLFLLLHFNDPRHVDNLLSFDYESSHLYSVRLWPQQREA